VRSHRTVQWPHGAKAAVMITVDLDAEFFWLSLDPGAVNRPKTLSNGQYGMKRGLSRVLQVLDDSKIKATFFVPGRIAEVYPQQVQEVAGRGHEIGHHGYAHENFALLSKEQQMDALRKGIDALQKVCGVRPAGFRAPEGDITHDTTALLQECGFRYSSTLNGADLPYFLALDGTPTDIVELCGTWELTDLPYFAFNFKPAFPSGQCRIANYSSVLSIWKDEFDAFYDMGLNYNIKFDPQAIGTPGRIPMLEGLLEYIKSRKDVWFCTGSEMADFWRSTQSMRQASSAR